MHWQRLTVLNRPRLSQIIAASTALMVAASLLIAAPSSAQQNPNPSPVLVVDPTATATFTGSGWGHGVGMSQWGGLARAQAGHSAQQILGFYYENTVLAENYGRPANGAEPPSSPGPSSTATPAAGESATPVVLATTGSTTLTPEGLNRITVDNQNIAVGGQNAARAPAGTPIDFARVGGLWQITFGATNVCGNGCSGQTVQLHFATDTAVAVSTTGRSYSHGRINLVAVANDPGRFHITLDSLSVETFLNDPHNDPAVPNTGADQTTGSTHFVLAVTQATTLTPQGLNRITIDNQNITIGGQSAARAPAGTPIIVTRVGGRWRIRYGNADLCGSGCSGQTVQLHFGTDTAVAMSTTGRSYSHGRFNLVAEAGDPNRFRVVLDSLAPEKFLSDPHNTPPGIPTADSTPATEPVIQPPPDPVHPEDTIRVHLSTTTGTTLTPRGANRITVDGQGEILVPAGTPVNVVYHPGHWHFTINGVDACGSNGCPGRTAQMHFATGTSVAVSNTGHSYSHGRINLVPAGGDPGTFYVILDSLSMEKYLRGIAETPMNWPLAIHEAQAIAARSYASTTLRERRASGSWNRPFDLYATVWDQAFVGDLREKHADAATWLQAVENTAGKVLHHGGAPIRAFYHASNGGHTERSGYVFSADLPYLPSKPDAFDDQAINPYSSWTRSYSVADLNRWLNDHTDTAVGQLISMETVGGIGGSGRLDKAQIRITGTSRTVTVTGNRLQSRINTAARESGQNQLLSTLFSFTVPPATVSTTPADPEDPVDITPANDVFFSGVINGPDFCLNFSLGGPTTYPFDSDGDGIADVCSLPTTRRVAVARQNALQDLKDFGEARQVFADRLAEECRSLLSVTFGESEQEAVDECAQYRDVQANPSTVPVPPTNPGPETEPADNNGSPMTADDKMFYSGVVNGPDFCLNRSLGGPITYAFDSNSDGIADVCSLSTTRRVAVARQRALEHLESQFSDNFELLFFSHCRRVPETFGEPEQEEVDDCETIRRSATI